MATLTAAANVVTLDGNAQYGSTDTMSYYANVEDARVAAVALIDARGWHFTTDIHRAAFLAGEWEGEMMWNEDGEHVGAIYAFALTAPVSV